MKKILFVCVENSCRSQIAEAFAKMHSPTPFLSRLVGKGENEIQVFSAGSKPSGRINEKAILAMKELGYDLTKHKSKSVNEILKVLPNGKDLGGASFEYVITMGCGDECPFIPTKNRIDWNLPDPKNLPMDEFRKMRDVIGRKVKSLISEIEKLT